MRIGVVSDTHIDDPRDPLPVELLRGLEGVDRILHAGDILIPEVLEQLARIAPVDAVLGNNEEGAIRKLLPYERELEFEGCRIGLWHGHGGSGANPPRIVRHWANREVDVLVFGHSHMPMVDWLAGKLLVNPGSPTEPRRAPWPSFAILTVGGELPSAEIIPLKRR